ncbi:2-hydroxyacyl-CoA dehydratase subunit D [Azospirillum agricola]|uniref:2-hydroxyacyl-CoA dehydratase subunit D n=1 Tax=Azospirillum agricola TaxID=1720247 RepID=UPI000A0EF76A|nr:2-hydroxyacyl-CoA dehydratase family protein [Azospirillum agricola]SMH38635.1 2-hydroxyglutaryl-CoA dehydratase, D-component [Azospirillum lipoferum]
MRRVEEIISTLSQAADDPQAYAAAWKEKGRKIVGILPMNFPSELVHAAGALPVLIQESRAPITYGRGLLFEFYCGYTRSLVDQAATKQLDVYDAFLLVDHCVALLGAADAMRFELPGKPIILAQFIASMDEDWNRPDIRAQVDLLKSQLADLCGTPVTESALSKSIALHNENRGLLRHFYDLRRSGKVRLLLSQMQVLVKSSMVMDIEEHTTLLRELSSALRQPSGLGADPVRLHLSGHFCHAPAPELLEMIESCGAVIVDDDIFTGYRYIATDVAASGDPTEAVVDWYYRRNAAVPCPTRAQKTIDWESYLVEAVRKGRADAVIVLVAKFCEPHMLYYPELRQELDRAGVPHLLIETEHEGLPLEVLRTRVEALVERVRRAAPALS